MLLGIVGGCHDTSIESAPGSTSTNTPNLWPILTTLDLTNNNVAFFIGSVRGYGITEKLFWHNRAQNIYTLRMYKCSRQDQCPTFTVHKLANAMEHNKLFVQH